LHQLQERILNDILGRMTPLPGVHHQRRAMHIQEPSQFLWAHLSFDDMREGLFREWLKKLQL
jgi:hypothetical protein